MCEPGALINYLVHKFAAKLGNACKRRKGTLIRNIICGKHQLILLSLRFWDVYKN